MRKLRPELYHWLVSQRLKPILRTVFLVAGVSLITAGCSTPAQQQSVEEPLTKSPEIPKLTFSTHPFNNKPQLLKPSQLFELSESQKKDYQNFRAQLLNKADNNSVKSHSANKNISLIAEHKIIGDFLENISKNFSYRGKTLVAQEALTTLNGNCMSLAVLTTALARHTQVEIGYQLVTDSPVYQKQESVVIRGQHVRSKLYDPSYQPKPGFFTIVKPSITIDYFPGLFSFGGRSVSEEEFIAMFYGNLAAENFILNNIEVAYWNSIESLKHYPTSAQTLNLLAIIYARLNLHDKAEAIYRYGIQYADQKIELLSNYHGFLMQNDREKEALLIEEQLKKLNEPNPFDWLDIAYEALRNNELRRAEVYFKKARKQAPYLHQPYAGLAIVMYQRGHLKESRELLEKALNISYEKDIKERYQNKLQAITVD